MQGLAAAAEPLIACQDLGAGHEPTGASTGRLMVDRLLAGDPTREARVVDDDAIVIDR